MALLMNQTLPTGVLTGDFVHHVIKRGLFDLNLKSRTGRQFVGMAMALTHTIPKTGFKVG